jgi:hypothetical protein
VSIEPPPAPEKQTDPTTPNLGLASIVTVVTLAAFLLAVALLWSKADSASEAAWARWTFLLAGLEAPAFAAVGWVFGKEVHRAQAAKAEQGEAEAQAKADAATADAEHLAATGSAMRRALDASGPATAPADRLGETRPPSMRAAAPDLAVLRAIAEGFPSG